MRREDVWRHEGFGTTLEQQGCFSVHTSENLHKIDEATPAVKAGDHGRYKKSQI